MHLYCSIVYYLNDTHTIIFNNIIITTTTTTTGWKKGKPLNSANCGKFFHGLDITNKEVQEYVSKCITTVTTVWRYR